MTLVERHKLPPDSERISTTDVLCVVVLLCVGRVRRVGQRHHARPVGVDVRPDGCDAPSVARSVLLVCRVDGVGRSIHTGS